MDLREVLDFYKDKTVLITGHTGFKGSWMCQILKNSGANVVGYSLEPPTDPSLFEIVSVADGMRSYIGDIRDLTGLKEVFEKERPQIVIHMAAQPLVRESYKDPVTTYATNVMGTAHLLDYAAASQARRFVFCSSVEIYGQNRGDTEAFREDYCGYLDCNTLRAAYPEGKRAGEALCQAYLQQRGVDFVTPRLARVYGPALLRSDTKALSQFIWNAVRREDIVLKSEGRQLYSYLYMADAALGLMYCMLLGETGHAYNLADPASDVTLRELAAMLAKTAGKQVVFDLPSELERKGYSTATKALLDAAKARGLGWKAHYGIAEGLERTVAVLRETLKETL